MVYRRENRTNKTTILYTGISHRNLKECLVNTCGTNLLTTYITVQ